MVATAVLATTFLVAPHAARAQSSEATLADGTQPVVVVTVASVNKLMQDVNYVTTLAGQQQFGGIFGMMAGTYAQGMDMDKPLGVLVPLVGGAPQPIVILPTKDIRPILKRLEAQTGPVDELDDGTLVVTLNQNTVYIKQAANHAVAAQNQAALALAPENTDAMFQGMGNAYNIAVRLKIQQIPIQIRNILIDQMRQGFEQTMAQQPDAESTREMAESTIEQIEQLIQEADELNVGFNIDQAGRAIALDVSFTAVSGTELASIYSGQQPIPSRFSSVIRDDAAAYIHSATSISREAADKANQSIESTMTMLRGALSNEGNLSEAQIKEIEGYVGRFTDIVSASIAEGKSDMGVMVLAGPDKFQAVFGAFVSDGNAVADLVKDLATKIPDVPDAPTFRFDVGNHAGVNLHVVEADVPEREDEVRKLFGDKLQIHIGTGPKAIYVAAGQGSESLLKEFISAGSNDNGGDRPLGQFKMHLLPFMELAQSVEENDGVAAVIAALTASDDKGEMSVMAKSIPNGSTMNLRIGEGLIKAIGAAAVAGQQPPPAF